jgi:hypothetical protein
LGQLIDPWRDQMDPLEAACSLVGRFLYHFARVEQKIDQAVIKLLDLDEKTAPVVALLGFATKVDDLVATLARGHAGPLSRGHVPANCGGS